MAYTPKYTDYQKIVYVEKLNNGGWCYYQQKVVGNNSVRFHDKYTAMDDERSRRSYIEILYGCKYPPEATFIKIGEDNNDSV